MNFEESYQKYIVLSESNGTTDNLSTDKGRFALKYNIAQNKVIEWLIESNSTDENRYLQSIKKSSPLTLLSSEDNFSSFSIPSDYFDFLNLKILASKGVCNNQLLKNREIKIENLNTYLLDPNLNPSFKFRETFYTISDNSVQVYKDDFNIDSVNMNYYRYPNQVKLIDPNNPESQFLNENLDFDDKLINRIIFMTVSLHQLSSNDPKYQAFKQETIQKY